LAFVLVCPQLIASKTTQAWHDRVVFILWAKFKFSV
jgi:hypothetical protein